MRNLKRALSLAMASVMTLGMMTVGASAKGIADFSDAAEITNADAVAVTSAVGIFKGYEDGEFKGDNVVTRAEMAVICAKLLYGADVDPAQFSGISKFTDVPTWAEGYVNLCASLGIIVGRDEKTFDPNSTVSTVEASVMLAKTLGYFKNQKDFGSDWKLATTAKATQLGLYGDLKLAADAGLTRDSVAELVFNTMTKAVPVDYNELLGVYYNQNQGIVYALEFNYLQTLGYKNFDLVYRVTGEDDDTVYGRPTTVWGIGSYDHSTNASDSLDNGQLDANGGLLPSRVRMLDRDEIIAITETPDYVYTKGTDADVIFKAMGASICETYDWDFYVNGKLVEKAIYDSTAKSYDYEDAEGKTIAAKNVIGVPTKVSETYEYTTKGAVTEIYVDKAEQKVTLCEINYFLGEVSSVKEDDDGEYANIKTLSSMDGVKLDDKKFYTDELEAEDLVVYTVDHKDLDDEYYIPELFTPATATGEVSRVEDKNDSDKTYIRLAGESDKYEYASEEHIVYDLADPDKDIHPDLNEDYILYMTPAGYVLGYEKVDETVDQYLYVKDSDEELKDWVAKIVLTDASTAKVDVKNDLKKTKDDKSGFDWKPNADGDVDIFWLEDATDSDKTGKYDLEQSSIDNRIWKYSVSDKGVYTLTWVDAVYPASKYEIENDEAYLDTVGKGHDVLTNSKTIFVDVKGGKSYVGHKNVPNVSDAEIAYVTNSKDVAIVVFILDGDVYDKDATYFFLADDDRESLKYDGEYYYEYTEAYDAEGKQFTLTAWYEAYDDTDTADAYDELEVGRIYKIKKTIDDIYATEIVDASYVAMGGVVAAGEDTFRITEEEGDVANTLKFDTDEDTQFVLVEELYKKDGTLKGYDVSKGDLDDMIEDIDDEGMTSTVYVIEADDQTAELVYIHNHKTDAPVIAELSEYVSDVEIAGMSDGAAELGDTLLVKLKVEDFKAKTINDGTIYTVVINGKNYEGYAIGSSYVYVVYTVDADAIEDGNVVLTIGKITETKKEHDFATVGALAKDAEVSSTFQDITYTDAEGSTTYNIYVTGSFNTDTGYSAYSVNSDAVTLKVTYKDEIQKVVDKLYLTAVDPKEVKFGTNVTVYYNEDEVDVDATTGEIIFSATV